MVRHKEYFSEYFGCQIAPIKRPWDIAVGVESDFYVSSISVRLILKSGRTRDVQSWQDKMASRIWRFKPLKLPVT
jgi:hypothetical protein